MYATTKTIEYILEITCLLSKSSIRLLVSCSSSSQLGLSFTTTDTSSADENATKINNQLDNTTVEFLSDHNLNFKLKSETEPQM